MKAIPTSNPTLPSSETSSSNQRQKGDIFYNLSLYDETPQQELSIDEFEDFALARLKVLRRVERCSIVGSSSNNGNAVSQLKKLFVEEIPDETADVVSHFILRAAYSLDEERRRWFLAQESTLFKYRLEALEKVDKKRFSKYCAVFDLVALDRTTLKDKWDSLKKLSPKKFSSDDIFYRVPFIEALDLVARRDCFVEGGFAYIPFEKVVSILVTKFRTNISRSLALLKSTGVLDAANRGPEADRIHPLLKGLHSCLVEPQPQTPTHADHMTPANIPNLVPHMPLCMRNLQKGLKQDKKLRYGGRQQYGLFLKQAGMSMEDAMLFFQQAFSAVTSERFQKEYSYNIRHMYGKEGKRKSYDGYSCSKIITESAPNSASDYHGCPYRHKDENQLASLLQSLQIGTHADRTKIIELKKQHQYQLACKLQFEVSHPNAIAVDAMDNVGNHPNAWFSASLTYANKNKD